MHPTLRLLIVLALLASFPASAQKPDAKDDELARVAILPFVDKTNSKKFGYLSGSLSDAIDKSMQALFEYKRIPPDQAEAAARKVKKPGEALTERSAKTLAKQAEYEIIISGFYVLKTETEAPKKKRKRKKKEPEEKQSQEIAFHTAIYFADANKWLELPVTRNIVDNTLFQATEKVAGFIVKDINRIAEEQARAEAKRKKQKEQERKEGEKLKLKRQKEKEKKAVAKTKPKTFASRNWVVTFGLGPGSPSTDFGDTNSTIMGLGARAVATRQVFGPFYAGSQLGFDLIFNNSTNITYEIFLGSLSALVGAAWRPGRWRLYADVGAGYYTGGFSTGSDAAGSTGDISESFQNPYFVGRGGFDFLLSQSFAMGLVGMFNIYYDKPEIFEFFSVALTFSYVF